MSHAMQVVASARIYPAKCACGSVNGPLVDTMQETIAGRVYLCSRCVATAAGLLGWTSPESTTQLADAGLALQRRIEVLNEELEFERTHREISVPAFVQAVKEGAAA